MSLLHNVYFWLKPETSAEQRGSFEREAALLTKLPYVENGFVGKPADTERREVTDHSFDYCLSLLFMSEKDEAFYQNECPDHRRFVETCGALFARVVVYDYVKLD